MSRRRVVADLPPVFRGADAVAAGLLTPSQLRGPYVRRVMTGVYRPAWVVETHTLRCEAAALVMPAAARVTGRSLATLRGVELVRRSEPVEVVLLGRGELRHSGLLVRRASRGPLGQDSIGGVPVVSPHRMAFDLAARHDIPTATAYLDAVVRAGLVDTSALAGWLASRHENDVCAVREACSLVDARAESLPESRLRVILVSSGVDVVVQHSVQHRGRTIARVDMAVRGLRLAIEYDGAWHALREQLERDRRRSNELSEAGWINVHVTAAMLKDPASVVALVRSAMARAATR